MKQSLEEALISALVGIMADGFNRSMKALEDAGAIDRAELNTKYKGAGSEYYDLVTSELERTAEYARPAIREIISNNLEV